MFYGCRRRRRRRHFASFYSQSMIEFKLAFYNAVARTRYLTIQRATFIADIVGFKQIDS